jgi:hypothetical protein
MFIRGCSFLVEKFATYFIAAARMYSQVGLSHLTVPCSSIVGNVLLIAV